MPNWIGDLVMATPILNDLREKFPQAEITAMCRGSGAALLEKEEAIDELFQFQPTPYGFLRRTFGRDVVGKLRAGQYDLALLLTNSFSSSWLFWQANIPIRIGFQGRWRRVFLTRSVAMPKERLHQVDRYKKLLEPLGIAKSESVPRLVLSNEEIDEAKELLYQRGYKQGSPLFGINPGAAYGSAKCWPKERFRSLALELLHAAPNAFLVFFGDSSTSSLVKEIVRDLPSQVMDLAGVTSLRELVSIIQDCDVLITNDSGPMHIGAALQIPLVALFGSTDEELTGPYGQEDAVIRKKVSCSPCFKRVCPIDFRCMREISVKEVAELAMHRKKERV